MIYYFQLSGNVWHNLYEHLTRPMLAIRMAKPAAAQRSGSSRPTDDAASRQGGQTLVGVTRRHHHRVSGILSPAKRMCFMDASHLQYLL